MISIRKALIFLFIFSFIIISCERVDTQAPAETTLDSTLVTPQSVIVVPVSYGIKDLELMVNTKLKPTLMKKWMTIGENKDSLYIEIQKTADIKITRKDRTLFYDVPVKVSGLYRAKIASVSIKNATPVSTSIVLKLASTFHMDSKWNLVPETVIRDIVWKEDPTVKVFGMKVNLRPVFEQVLTSKQNEVTDIADKALMQILNTNKIVSKLWLDIQKPIRINKKVKEVWLKPYNTEMTGRLLDTHPDSLSLEFELKSVVRTYIEGDSIPASNPTLPDFVQKQNDNDSLVVFVHSTVDFKLINEIINKELGGKKFEKGKLDVTIKKIKVYGTDDGIAVKLTVKGAIDGDLYALGHIQFDSSSKVVALRDLNFLLDTKNVLANSADWFLHSNVLELVQDKLEFNTELLADKLPQIIMGAVEKGKTGEKIDINVGHLDVWPQRLLITKDNIQLIVRASGRGSVGLEQKLFEGKKKGKPSGPS